MCILFLHTTASPVSGGFRLILALNRDEVYQRPTLPAHFWTEDPTVIGGRDMEPGREGGTWLAMSKYGRIGALLNIFHTNSISLDSPPLGRGNIASNFVLGNSSPQEYITELSDGAAKYSPFTLLAIQIQANTIAASVYSNASDSGSTIENLGTGTYAQGNNLIGRPFTKVTEGSKRFDQIVRDYGTTRHKEKLRDELISLLRWDQKHYPDSEMQRRGPLSSEEKLQTLSSVFVKSPTYGTRTHTVILVDNENNVSFSELTMTEPIDPVDPSWSKTEKNFQLSI